MFPLNNFFVSLLLLLCVWPGEFTEVIPISLDYIQFSIIFDLLQLIVCEDFPPRIVIDRLSLLDSLRILPPSVLLAKGTNRIFFQK